MAGGGGSPGTGKCEDTFEKDTLMSRFITSLLLGAVALCATTAFAGPLTTDPAAYFDGFVTWHSTTPYQGYLDYPTNNFPSNLSGTIDWAVYSPGTFPAGYLGYTPTAG